MTLTPILIPPVLQRLFAELADELDLLEDQSLRRHLTTIERVNGPIVQINGREVVCWCSNDYLGLSMHPALIEAAAQAATQWGVGARASRLLAGTTRVHEQLEDALTTWFGAEAAIVYPSGYLANLGTLSALCGPQDVIFLDRLAHASLIDAARASRATLRVFHHNDVAHLATLLKRASRARRRMIVTEGVFSMDGDRAPLAALADVAQAHEAIVYLDDAHGTFVLGETARGSPEAAGVTHEHFLYMGTLGKALGGQGGFVVGPRTLIELLRNRARTFIYTTALAVPLAAAAITGLHVLAEEPTHRQRLGENVTRLHERLAALGIARASSPSHIVPMIVGEVDRALALAAHLWDRGCWAPAVRPPTVPEGGARIRLSVSALHTPAQIDALAQALSESRR